MLAAGSQCVSKLAPEKRMIGSGDITRGTQRTAGYTKVQCSSPYTQGLCGVGKTIHFDESFSSFRENALIMNE